jgi:hypothetical protein
MSCGSSFNDKTTLTFSSVALQSTPDLVAAYRFNLNTVNTYNALSGPVSFVEGVLTFTSASVALTTSTALLTRTGASISASSGNTCVAVHFQYAVLPAARATILQIGTQNATSGASLTLTLETTGQLVLWASSSDYRTYPAISPNAWYALLINKAPNAPYILYANGVLQTPTATTGAPVYAAYAANAALSLGAAGAAPVGAQLKNLRIFYGNPNPYSPDVPPLGGRQQSVLSSAGGALLNMPVTIGALSANTFLVGSGAALYLGNTAVPCFDVVARYTSSNTNDINSSYNTLVCTSGTASFNAFGPLVFTSTSDSTRCTSITNLSGVSLVNLTNQFSNVGTFNRHGNLAIVSMTFSSPSNSVLWTLGDFNGTQAVGPVAIYSSGSQNISIYYHNNWYFTTTSPPIPINTKTNVVMLLAQTPIIYINGILATYNTSGSDSLKQYSSNTLYLGYNNNGNAPCDNFTIYDLALGITTSGAYTAQTFASVVAGISPLVQSAGHPDIIVQYTAYGTLTNASPYYSGLTSPGFVNGAFTFTGGDQDVCTRLNTRTGVGIDTLSGYVTCVSFTLSVNNATGGGSSVFTIGDFSAAGNGQVLHLRFDSSYTLLLYTGNSSYYTYGTISPFSAYAVFIVKTASAYALYLNGVLQSSVSSTGSPGTVAAFNTNLLTIGDITFVAGVSTKTCVSNFFVGCSSATVYTPATFAALSPVISRVPLTTTSFIANAPVTLAQSLSVPITSSLAIGFAPGTTAMVVSGKFVRPAPATFRRYSSASQNPAYNGTYAHYVVTFDTLDTQLSQGYVPISYSNGVFTNVSGGLLAVSIDYASTNGYMCSLMYNGVGKSNYDLKNFLVLASSYTAQSADILMSAGAVFLAFFSNGGFTIPAGTSLTVTVY